LENKPKIASNIFDIASVAFSLYFSGCWLEASSVQMSEFKAECVPGEMSGNHKAEPQSAAA
jgi:hypothetical protein